MNFLHRVHKKEPKLSKKYIIQFRLYTYIFVCNHVVKNCSNNCDILYIMEFTGKKMQLMRIKFVGYFIFNLFTPIVKCLSWWNKGECVTTLNTFDHNRARFQHDRVNVRNKPSTKCCRVLDMIKLVHTISHLVWSILNQFFMNGSELMMTLNE